MNTKINIEFSTHRDQLRLFWSKNNETIAVFNVAEEFVAKVSYLFQEKKINLRDVQITMNLFLKKSYLRTNYLGAMEVLHDIHKAFPDLSLNSGLNYLEQNKIVFAQFPNESCNFAFLKKDVDEYVTLSNCIISYQQAENFINFLLNTNSITESFSEMLITTVAEEKLFSINMETLKN
ncbi:MAG: hypothetical protein MRY57_01270 [Candidatus Pacebacteria bacterium]|nr:hypothetical protein [Candidatus Paceibacterota bacterium]